MVPVVRGQGVQCGPSGFFFLLFPRGRSSRLMLLFSVRVECAYGELRLYSQIVHSRFPRFDDQFHPSAQVTRCCSVVEEFPVHIKMDCFFLCSEVCSFPFKCSEGAAKGLSRVATAILARLRCSFAFRGVEVPVLTLPLPPS